MPLGGFRINGLGRRRAPTGRTPATMTAVGNSQISTAQQKFGSGSLRHDGTGDALYSTNVDSFSMAGNFTIECWFRLDALNRNHYIIGNRSGGGFGEGDWTVYHQPEFQRIQIASPNFTQINISASGNYTTNTWYHLAIVRSGSTTTAYLNGVSKGTTTHTATIFSTNKKIIIGALSETGGDSMLGYIDEVRISNIARYTSNFTPPSAEFNNDANTLFLMHFNGTNGSTTFTDDNT
jgi:hypothetical protein